MSRSRAGVDRQPGEVVAGSTAVIEHDLAVVFAPEPGELAEQRVLGEAPLEVAARSSAAEEGRSAHRVAAPVGVHGGGLDSALVVSEAGSSPTRARRGGPVRPSRRHRRRGHDRGRRYPSRRLLLWRGAHACGLPDWAPVRRRANEAAHHAPGVVIAPDLSGVQGGQPQRVGHVVDRVSRTAVDAHVDRELAGQERGLSSADTSAWPAGKLRSGPSRSMLWTVAIRSPPKVEIPNSTTASPISWAASKTATIRKR